MASGIARALDDRKRFKFTLDLNPCCTRPGAPRAPATRTGPVANRSNGIPMREPESVTDIILKAYHWRYGGAYYIRFSVFLLEGQGGAPGW